jgi:hypothetical protein
MCIPADSLLWALAARIRDERYAATVEDMRALVAALGGRGDANADANGRARARIREVLRAEAARWPAAPFSVALAALESLEAT